MGGCLTKQTGDAQFATVLEGHRFWRVTAPDQLWCMDFKGYFLTGDVDRCDSFTISDEHSRFLFRCQAVARRDLAQVSAVCDVARRKYGVPEHIRTDNGAPFAGGWSAWAVEVFAGMDEARSLETPQRKRTGCRSEPVDPAADVFRLLKQPNLCAYERGSRIRLRHSTHGTQKASHGNDFTCLRTGKARCEPANRAALAARGL